MTTNQPVRVESDMFVPSNGNLIIRDNISENFNVSPENYRKSGHLRRPATMGGYRFGQLSMSSFFTRHNPNPTRVKHFKGLLDVPICRVNDFDVAKKDYFLEFPPNSFARSKLGIPTDVINVNAPMYPMDTLTGLHYFHSLKQLPFGRKSAPHVGSPDAGKEIEPWRKELQDIAKAAGLNTSGEEKPKQQTAKRTSQYSSETGRLIPPPTKGYSRQSSRMKTQEQFVNSFNSQRGNPLDAANVEDTVMMILCQILQTEDVDAVKTWLGNAGENEKNMIQELLKAAMEGKADGHPTQFPIQEYMVGIEGLPMTPDVGTTIGENVQNRLSTADDTEQPAIPEPSMRPPSAPGPAVEEAVARIEQTSPRIMSRNQPLPPIAETIVEPSVGEKVEGRPNSKPLPAIPKQQESFNKALENITRQTLENLSNLGTNKEEMKDNAKKFTRYPMKTVPKGQSNPDARLKLSSAGGQKCEKDARDSATDVNISTVLTDNNGVWNPGASTAADPAV